MPVQSVVTVVVLEVPLVIVVVMELPAVEVGSTVTLFLVVTPVDTGLGMRVVDRKFLTRPGNL